MTSTHFAAPSSFVQNHAPVEMRQTVHETFNLPTYNPHRIVSDCPVAGTLVGARGHDLDCHAAIGASGLPHIRWDDVVNGLTAIPRDGLLTQSRVLKWEFILDPKRTP